jgi:hypothetical protein
VVVVLSVVLHMSIADKIIFDQAKLARKKSSLVSGLWLPLDVMAPLPPWDRGVFAEGLAWKCKAHVILWFRPDQDSVGEKGASVSVRRPRHAKLLPLWFLVPAVRKRLG